MKTSQLTKLINGRTLTAGGEDQDVACGYTCDLLSWVMAKGRQGCAWVTVQTHLNVIAVASLHDMACVICPEGIEMEAASIKKAEDEGIAVISSPLTAYAICGLMSGAGIPAV